MDTLFIWLGYDSFLQWLADNTLSNIYWCLQATPLAMTIWVVLEVLYGKRIQKRFKAFVRWVKRYAKPGPMSEHDQLVVARRQLRKARTKIREQDNLLLKYKEGDRK